MSLAQVTLRGQNLQSPKPLRAWNTNGPLSQVTRHMHFYDYEVDTEDLRKAIQMKKHFVAPAASFPFSLGPKLAAEALMRVGVITQRRIWVSKIAPRWSRIRLIHHSIKRAIPCGVAAIINVSHPTLFRDSLLWCKGLDSMAAEPLAPSKRKQILRVIFISLLLDLVNCFK